MEKENCSNIQSNNDAQRRARVFEKTADAVLKKMGLPEGTEGIRKVFEDKKLLGRFLRSPIVAAYLCRPSQQVSFDENGEPKLDSEYEKEIYRVLKDSNEPILYREEGFFYSSGASKRTMNHLDNFFLQHENRINLPEDIHCALSIKRKMLSTLLDIYAYPEGDKELYFLGREPRKQNILLKEGISFLIFPEAYDTHALTYVAIIDNKSQNIRAILLINSRQFNQENEHYIDHINHMLSIYDAQVQDSGGKFKNIPVIDCSIDLQTAKEDVGCAIYRLCFTRALMNLVERHPDLIRSIGDAPLLSKEEQEADNRWVKEQAENKMRETYREQDMDKKLEDFIRQEEEKELAKHPPHLERVRQDISSKFTEALMEELPDFFKKGEDGKFERRNDDEIKLQQCRIRWEVGNAYLKDLSKQCVSTRQSALQK